MRLALKLIMFKYEGYHFVNNRVNVNIKDLLLEHLCVDSDWDFSLGWLRNWLWMSA